MAGQGKLASLARPFLDAVAEPAATPGGGSVAALSAALAASLGQMVAGLSRKKKAQATNFDRLSELMERLRKIANDSSEVIDLDAASYDAVLAAFKSPQGTEEESKAREAAIQQATLVAAQVPLP